MKQKSRLRRPICDLYRVAIIARRDVKLKRKEIIKWKLYFVASCVVIPWSDLMNFPKVLIWMLLIKTHQVMPMKAINLKLQRLGTQ
jgi:hypothetical protein